MSQTPLVTGMVLGGVVISAIGAASMKFVEEKDPSAKSLARDFIIGAVMVAMIVQLLPESSESVINFVMAMVPLALFTEGKKVIVDAVAVVAEEEEVKVGVPRF